MPYGRKRRRTGHGRRFGQSGFSLLEVLVAFVILSLVATALFRLFSGALGNGAAAGDYSRAVMVAESVLTEASAAETLQESTQTGTTDDGEITWTAKVAPYAPSDVPPNVDEASTSMLTKLYRITAEVSFAAPSGGRRTFELATVRIGTKDAK